MLRRNCAMRFGRVVRVLLSPLSLHFLVFPWPKWAFSMGYGESK
jgi:hypothetical protein